MFKRSHTPAKPTPTGAERQIIAALEKVARELTAQRLESAALRRVFEAATGYEHPAHARLRANWESAPGSWPTDIHEDSPVSGAA